ncbi:MAG TPA: CoA ester lyase [Chloroflexota bacterium]|jgi:citrate lyase subunit beta/citryl-CoA lyase
MRSKLFVPGSRPELFAKALASGADAVSIDLEDAVAEPRKTDARSFVSDFLRTVQTDHHLTVRVNGLATPHFAADVEAVALPTLDSVTLPKAESADDIHMLAEMLARHEGDRRVGILATIESPRGLRNAAAIAAADERVIGLQLGLGDLFEPLGIDRSEVWAVRQLQLQVRLAAGEAGVGVFDGAYTDVSNGEGYRQEAEAARKLGYSGKSCIHPSQVPIANAVFRPTDDEIAAAQRVVEAWHEAQRNGVGALLVDGKMIDLPFARSAERVVALARELNLL